MDFPFMYRLILISVLYLRFKVVIQFLMCVTKNPTGTITVNNLGHKCWHPVLYNCLLTNEMQHWSVNFNEFG